MEIYVSWTKIIAAFAAYQGMRYLYHTYLKWVTGCADIFDPSIPFDAAMIARDENRDTLWQLRREREKTEQQNAVISQLQTELRQAQEHKTQKKKA